MLSRRGKMFDAHAVVNAYIQSSNGRSRSRRNCDFSVIKLETVRPLPMNFCSSVSLPASLSACSRPGAELDLLTHYADSIYPTKPYPKEASGLHPKCSSNSRRQWASDRLAVFSLATRRGPRPDVTTAMIVTEIRILAAPDRFRDLKDEWRDA